jgi:hypothetical protein
MYTLTVTLTDQDLEQLRHALEVLPFAPHATLIPKLAEALPEGARQFIANLPKPNAPYPPWRVAELAAKYADEDDWDECHELALLRRQAE